MADRHNNKIRKISPLGVVSTFAGSGLTGSDDGEGAETSFGYPEGVVLDAAGNVYVADTWNHKIRKISPTGLVSTLAGSGVEGSADGEGAEASFYYPEGVAVDAAGNVYVADTYNHKIRKISPTGVVSTLAGLGYYGSHDGEGAEASFYYPEGVAVDVTGNVYVADGGNHKIRKISPSGEVSTLAGSGVGGSVDGEGAAASFYNPSGVAADAAGNVYVADYGNNKIRKISPTGEVSTLAGTGEPGSADGEGSEASFYLPTGVAVDAIGNVYVADYENRSIRKITIGGAVTGITEANTSSTSSFYPNPATEVIFVTGTEVSAYVISNAIGSTVQAGAMLGNSIAIGTLPSGLYLLTLHDESGRKITTSFVKK